MQNIRIVEIPPMKAVYSGPLTDGAKMGAFIAFFSKFNETLKSELAPRDFMWYNEKKDAREWFYALPAQYDPALIPGYEITDLPCGLYAVASCLDADFDEAQDWLQTRAALLAWAQQSDRFRPYENAEGKPERYPMFRIVSPPCLYEQGISIEDLYFPIEPRV